MAKESGMVRTTIWLRPDQVEALRKRYDETGAKPAEQIRRAVDTWLKKGGK